MKSQIIAALIAASAATAAHAGELTKASFNADFALEEACTPSVCTASFTVKGSLAGQATITESELNQFGSDTEIVVSPGIGSESVTYRLGDDPNYSPGDPSASFDTEEVVFGGIPVSVKTTLKFSNGKISVKQKFTGKGTESEPHVNSTSEPAPFTKGAVKHRTKSHDLLTIPFAIVAENSDIEFYAAEGVVLPDATMAEIESQKASIGEASIRIEQSVKSKEFLNLNEIP